MRQREERSKAEKKRCIGLGYERYGIWRNNVEKNTEEIEYRAVRLRRSRAGSQVRHTESVEKRERQVLGK